MFFCFYPIQSAQKEFYSDLRVAILNPDVVHVQTLCFFVAWPDMYILNECMLRVCAGLLLIILFCVHVSRNSDVQSSGPVSSVIAIYFLVTFALRTESVVALLHLLFVRFNLILFFIFIDGNNRSDCHNLISYSMQRH